MGCCKNGQIQHAASCCDSAWADFRPRHFIRKLFRASSPRNAQRWKTDSATLPCVWVAKRSYPLEAHASASLLCPMGDVMITPRPDLTLRSERPPFDIRRWQWTLAAIIRPFIKHRLKRRYDARMERVVSLIASVRNCNTRESLESLLGPPRYAMDGRLYSVASADVSNVIHPDSVEVYKKDGCAIELWFKDGEVASMIGCPSPTSWEIVAGVLIGNIP